MIAKPDERELVIKFWGTRGSIPVSGAEVAKYGGNTTCISLRTTDHLIIIDAGSGFYALSKSLQGSCLSAEGHIFFTHYHWDHICGLPFFKCFFNSEAVFNLYGSKVHPISVRGCMERVFGEPFSPLSPDKLPSKLNYIDFEEGSTFDLGAGLKVHTISTDHPGGNTAYRFDYHGKSFAHLSDIEDRSAEVHRSLIEFVKDVDYMSYDSFFTREEYVLPEYIGWGHSNWEKGIHLSKAAGVKNFILFHHAPHRSDADIDEIEKQAQSLFPNSIAAYDGMEIVLS